MEKFKKIYLGKGRQVTNLRIVKATVKLEDLKAIAYEYEGVDYVSFEIAKMLNQDQYGRTHSIYYRKKVKLVSETETDNQIKTTGEAVSLEPDYGAFLHLI